MADAAALLEANRPAFERYYELLVEWNEKMNLTAITDKDDVFHKHFLDSLLVVDTKEWEEVAAKSGSCADVGTGAGFPGLPLALTHPNMSFVLFDSLQKRVQFVRHVCSEIGADNVQVVHGRAEDVAKVAAYRNAFDAVVSRAVARLNVLAEITLPFAKVGGYVFSYKGPNVEEELADGMRAARTLGGRVLTTHQRALPGDAGLRPIVVLGQEKPTPNRYPRKAGTPQKQPL